MNKQTPHDPFAMRSLEQILALFDGGDFLDELMEKHTQLMADMKEHREAFNSKTKGSMTLQVNYELGKHGDLIMHADASFKPPKAPASSASAFIDDQGNMTLYSPLMARMETPVRDANVPDHDPETGEIKDAN